MSYLRTAEDACVPLEILVDVSSNDTTEIEAHVDPCRAPENLQRSNSENGEEIETTGLGDFHPGNPPDQSRKDRKTPHDTANANAASLLCPTRTVLKTKTLKIFWDDQTRSADQYPYCVQLFPKKNVDDQMRQ